MQLSCRLVPPPQHAHGSSEKNVTFIKIPLPGCRHANLVNILGVTQCDSPTPLKILATLLGCQTLLGMNVKNISLNFYSNTRPCVLHTNQKQLQSHSGAPIPKPGESALETRLPMKVIFNTIFLSLFFCAAPSSKLHAGVTRDGAIISMKLKGPRVSSSGLLPRI